VRVQLYHVYLSTYSSEVPFLTLSEHCPVRSCIPCTHGTWNVRRSSRMTDRLFNPTEKTGSAPPGGLNDLVSLTLHPIAPTLTIVIQFCRIWFITEMTWQFCITASIQCK